MYLIDQQDLCSSMCAVLQAMIIKYNLQGAIRMSPTSLSQRLENIGIHMITICIVKLLLQTVHPPERLAVSLIKSYSIL